MKIRTKLIISTSVLLAGVAAMAAASLLLVKGIETHVHGLTDRTVPLYTDVLRLRYTVQDMASDFFELGKAEDLAQLEQVSGQMSPIPGREASRNDCGPRRRMRPVYAAFEMNSALRVAVRKRLETRPTPGAGMRWAVLADPGLRPGRRGRSPGRQPAQARQPSALQSHAYLKRPLLTDCARAIRLQMRWPDGGRKNRSARPLRES